MCTMCRGGKSSNRLMLTAGVFIREVLCVYGESPLVAVTFFLSWIFCLEEMAEGARLLVAMNQGCEPHNPDILEKYCSTPKVN